MKRLLILTLILTMITSGMTVNAKSNNLLKDLLVQINDIHEDFSDWKHSDFKEYQLYDQELNESGILFASKEDSGYIIYDTNEERIVQFSADESPYASKLEAFKVTKKINTKNVKSEYLIYEGATFYGYAIEEENSEKVFYNFGSVVLAEDLIDGVPDMPYYNGCARKLQQTSYITGQVMVIPILRRDGLRTRSWQN